MGALSADIASSAITQAGTPQAEIPQTGIHSRK